MAVRPTTPPTTPPAIAPVLEFDEGRLFGLAVIDGGIYLDAVRGDAEAVVLK